MQNWMSQQPIDVIDRSIALARIAVWAGERLLLKLSTLHPVHLLPE
jgi:hypothetical protein